MPSPPKKKTPSRLEELEADLKKFAKGADFRNITYIKALCQSLQDIALAYYHSGASAQERLQHVEAIAQALGKIQFNAGQKQFTIAAQEVPRPNARRGDAPAYTCDPPRICVGGICVMPPSDGG